MGDIRSDGFIFAHYKSKPPHGPLWLNPAAFHRFKIRSAMGNMRKRATDKGLPFDLSIDYLCSIFPTDNKCPALGIELSWGDKDGRENSPSLDRIIPSLGYVQTNVAWLSEKANRIKTNATTEELFSVANYLKKANIA